MPELPEVETIRRQLEPEISGKKIAGIEIYDPRLTSPIAPDNLKRQLRGRTIESVGRRGKYLLFTLDSGEILVIHLRMTGRLTLVQLPRGVEDKKHLRLLIRFPGKEGLAFHDIRRFGRAFVLSRDDTVSYWLRLGPEPLGRGFNARYLRNAFRGRRRPVKSALLDQSLIAGIGNIYADEALFAARLHPLRMAGDIDDEEIARLTRAIKDTLRRAIRLEGSSIDTYRDSRGRSGRFQETFRVHRREGKPCPACGDTVQKIRVGGRGTYFCPGCQRL